MAVTQWSDRSHGPKCGCSRCGGKGGFSIASFAGPRGGAAEGGARVARSNLAVRHVPSMWALLAAVLIALCACATTAHAALLGIDLGGEFLKVALVKPGKIPISIAVNAMTKRKTPAVFGIVKGERLLGEDAAAIVPRYPERVLFNARELVGVRFTDEMEKELFTKHGIRYEFDRDGSASVYASWRSENGTAYDAVELLSNILYQAKEIGALNTDAEVKDAVISVPAYFGQSQLQAVAAAAEVAGLNVMSLMTDHAAAALQFGIDRDFKNNTQTIIFYDMGATGLTTSLIEFSTYKGSDMGKKKDIGQFIVKGVKWDATLGSSELEHVLMEHFVDEFHEKHKVDVDIRTVPRAMAKMRKNVKKLKEVLSANKDAFLSVQSLYDDIDFTSKITREKFEELAGDFWSRSTVPLKALLEETETNVDDVTGIELVGGNTRVPKLQETLTDFLGGRGLDKHLDASEAIALGSGFKAANLSTSFRVRKFGGNDVNPYDVHVRTFPLPNSDEDFVPLTRLIAPKWKKSNVPKTFALANSTSDFGIHIEYANELPPGVTSPEIASYNITGVAEKIAKFNNTGKHEVSVKFGWKLESILYIEKASVAVLVNETYTEQVQIEEEEEEEAKEEAKEEDGEKGTAEGEKDAEADTEAGDGEEGEAKDKQEDGGDGEKAKEGDAVDSEKAKTKEAKKKKEPKYETVYKQREVTKRILLSVSEPVEALPQPDDAQYQSYADRMKSWAQFDADKREQEKAKNDLEGFIISSKEMLYEETIEEVTTEEEREKYREELNGAEDWLYDDGDSAPVSEYRKRFNDLSEQSDAIKHRAAELERRPKIVELARKQLDETKGKLGAWNMDKAWLTDVQKKDVVQSMEKLDAFIDSCTNSYERMQKHEDPDPKYTTDKIVKMVKALMAEVTRVEKLKKPEVKKEDKKEDKKEEVADEKEEAPEGEGLQEEEEEEEEERSTDGAEDEGHTDDNADEEGEVKNEDEL